MAWLELDTDLEMLAALWMSVPNTVQPMWRDWASSAAVMGGVKDQGTSGTKLKL